MQQVIYHAVLYKKLTIKDVSLFVNYGDRFRSIDNEFDLTLGHYVEMCSKLGIIVDFDGTLSPLARTPELAFIPPETKKV